MRNKSKFLTFISFLSLVITGCGTGGSPSADPSVDPSVTPSVEPSVEPSIDPSEPTPQGDAYVVFHYSHPGVNYDDYALWLWAPKKDGAEYFFDGVDDYGAYGKYSLDIWPEAIVSNTLNFIVKSKGSWDIKDPDMDRSVDFGWIVPNEQNEYHVYLKTGDPEVYLDDSGVLPEVIKRAALTRAQLIVQSTFKIKQVDLYADEDVILTKTVADEEMTTSCNIGYPEDFEADFLKDYSVRVVLENGHVLTSEVSTYSLFDSDQFTSKYNYDGELGAIYTQEHTEFKVWSPISKEVKLRIYDTGTPLELGGTDTPTIEVPMELGEKGVWTKTIDGDLEGKYYTYVVTNKKYNNQEVVDPYAKSAGVNGLRGMVVDFSKTNPSGWDSVNYLDYDRKELTVYETHVCDVTSSDTWGGSEENRLLFNGVIQSGTTYSEGGVTVSTGFDHIVELGVNAIQFIPIFDQANDEVNKSFNWGYNPLNYNVVEGSYSSNPYDGYVRIREFKELVMAFNKVGISVIMDVVYNHVNGVDYQSFDVLVPEYYFRRANGSLSNGSGCGNETASDRYMFAKFMEDSTKFWLEEYKLGGFRFDLMGLHPWSMMNNLIKELQTINPHVVVYGEPWEGGSTPLEPDQRANQANQKKFKGYGAFNDKLRDALIKGGMKGVEELGFIANMTTAINADDELAITKGIRGTVGTGGSSYAQDPNLTTNYVTCHDNYTLYDRFMATGAFDLPKDATIEQIEERDQLFAKMNVLANSIVFLSQGTTFMLAGEEFLRTKGGDGNSYKSDYSVNELDYSLKVKHLDMFENYQKLITFKQNVDGLHLGKDDTTASKFKVVFNENKTTIEYSLKDVENNIAFKVLIRNGLDLGEVEDTVYDLSNYNLFWSTTQGNDKVLSSTTALDPFETLIVSTTLEA